MFHLKITLCASQGDKSLVSQADRRTERQPTSSRWESSRSVLGRQGGKTAGGQTRCELSRQVTDMRIPANRPGKQVAGQTYRHDSRRGERGRQRQVARRTRGLCEWPHGPKALGTSSRASRSSQKLFPTLQGKAVTSATWPGLATRIPLENTALWLQCVPLSQGTSNHLNLYPSPGWPPASPGLSHS